MTKFFKIGLHLEVAGSNKTEARANAIIAAARMIDDTYSPFLFTDRMHTLLVWREPQIGWTHKIIWPLDSRDPAHGPNVYACMVAQEQMREVAISKGIYHFAQTLYQEVSELPELLRKRLRQMDLDDLAHYYTIRQELPR